MYIFLKIDWFMLQKSAKNPYLIGIQSYKDDID